MKERASADGRSRFAEALAFCATLLGLFTSAAHADCTCSATCTNCLSCPSQYETVGSCGACYQSTNLESSVLCKFTGTPAPTSALPRPGAIPGALPGTFPGTLPGMLPGMLPGTRLETITKPPRWIPGTLPGTRPDFSRPDVANILPGIWPDAFRPFSAKPPAVGWILPGTRPDQIQPAIAEILPGTRPDSFEPFLRDAMQAAPLGWNVLPGAKPDQTDIAGTRSVIELKTSHQPDAYITLPGAARDIE